MAQQSSSPSRRWRRVGLGAAAMVVLAAMVWLGLRVLGAAAPASSSLPSGSQGGWSLVQSQHCLRCHGMVQTHVGPGFAQIAQRYRSQPDAQAYLARKIREGSAGVWGRKLMPRQPGVSVEQAQAMAVWVMAQPDPESGSR